MAIWVTSDWHFGHEKDFIWTPRGYKSWTEAAEDTIKRFNAVVNYEDIVYVLGDCMLKNDDYGIKCIKRLHGTKFLAIGNHDTDARLERYAEEGLFEDIQVGYRFKAKGITFWLTHYPMKMGNYKEKHPVWNLSGHTHLKDVINGEDCIYNVALDAHENNPVNLEDIIVEINEYRRKYQIPQ